MLPGMYIQLFAKDESIVDHSILFNNQFKYSDMILN